jgi:hypothetical protein
MYDSNRTIISKTYKLREKIEYVLPLKEMFVDEDGDELTYEAFYLNIS